MRGMTMMKMRETLTLTLVLVVSYLFSFLLLSILAFCEQLDVELHDSVSS